MYDKPVRMRPFPTGVRIGAEPGMHESYRGLVVRILQVFEERTQLAYQEHSLVGNRAA